MSLEEAVVGPAPQRRTISWGNLITSLIIIVALAGIAAGLFMYVLPSLERIEAQTKPAVVEVRPQGSVWDSRPSIWFRHAPYNMTDKEALDATLAGLSNAKHLHELHLCAAELRTEAAAQRAVVEANKQFPRNMPYNHKPGQFDDHYGQFEARATALEAAAGIAEAESIACVNDDKPWHTTEITITVADGTSRAVDLNDGGILFLTITVERAKQLKYCVSAQKRGLEKLETREVSSTTENFVVLSEQDKAIGDAKYRAILTLLEGFPETKDC